MNSLIVKRIQKALEYFEWKNNGFDKLSGTDVLVKNIRIKKDEVIADVILYHDIETGHTETFRNIKYSRELVIKLIKQVS